MSEQLKLKAQSSADLEVISAVLQDAAVRVGDIAHLEDRRQFALVLSRYRWEKTAGSKRKRKKGERVRTGLHFESVLKAEAQHVPMQDSEHVLALLAIEAEESGDGNVVIKLEFSGYATIRLTVECIEAYLKDMTAPWRALTTPAHALD